MSLKNLDSAMLSVYYAANTVNARGGSLKAFTGETPWNKDENELIFHILSLSTQAARINSQTIERFYQWLTDLVQDYDEAIVDCERILTRLSDDTSDLAQEFTERLTYFLDPARELQRCLHVLKDI